MNTRVTAYVGETTPARAKCLRGVIGKLQSGDIDLHKVPFDLDLVYAVWACDVIVVAEISNETVVLIDVLAVPADSV